MFYYKTVEDKDGLWLLEDAYRREYIAKTESVFAQCNGHFGVRASFDFDGIMQNRGMFVSGLYQKPEQDEVTELVNCPDICGVEVYLDGERLSLDTARVTEFVRKLNVYTGELVMSWVLTLKNECQVRIESRRFASRADNHLFCQKLKLELLNQQEAEISLTYGINGQITNSGASHFHKTECRVYDKRYMAYQGALCDDGLELLLTGRLNCKAIHTSFQLKRRSIYQKEKLLLKKHEPLELTRIGYVREWSQNTKETQQERMGFLERAMEAGYEELLLGHKQIMKDFWKYAKIQIEGAALEETASICFAQYHLYGMVPDYTERYSAGAKGLTGEGYKGHVFWDTEIFLLPFFYYVFPEKAQNLLKYRYHGIEGAKSKAEQYGYQGLMFPWEAAKNGYEETPLYAALNIHTGKANKVWSGMKEHHVTADIVYAVMQYASVTEDWEFIKNYGSEMVFGAADFWVSRAVQQNDRIEIVDIIGPDEYNEHIDNNAYTNYMARFTVQAALYLAEKLQERDPKYSKDTAAWKEFVSDIYLPKPEEDGIIPQDDSFRKKKELEDIEKYRNSQIKQSVLLDYSRDEVVDMQVLKQADLVMLLNLFPALFSPEIVKKNVLFYESRTLHDSSLSYCAHAQACASIGAQDMAWQFFEKALEVDLVDNPYDSVDGIHAASLGGIWNCVIQGFAGLLHDWEKLVCNPHLPKHWKEIKFSFQYREQRILAVITKEKIILETATSFKEAVNIQIGSRIYTWKRKLEVAYEKDE